MSRSRVWALTLLIFAAGCPDESEGTTTTSSSSSTGVPACTLPFLGDETKEPEIEIFYQGADLADHTCEPGGSIDIVEPPQGGRVIFVGVRATNVDPCGVTLTGALRDLSNMQVRFDTRNLNLLAEGNGYGRSSPGDIAAYSNIPVCHNTWTESDIFDETFGLEVTLKDRRGEQVMKTLQVVPVCAEPTNEAQCRCICGGGYMLGDACSGGGPGGGGPGGGGGGE